MLSLQMKSGDYVTIGNQVVVQVFKESGPQFRISIKAPREISIVRGKVLERDGEMRPEGLLDRGPKRSPSDQRGIFKNWKSGWKPIGMDKNCCRKHWAGWMNCWTVPGSL